MQTSHSPPTTAVCEEAMTYHGLVYYCTAAVRSSRIGLRTHGPMALVGVNLALEATLKHQVRSRRTPDLTVGMVDGDETNPGALGWTRQRQRQRRRKQGVK